MSTLASSSPPPVPYLLPPYSTPSLLPSPSHVSLSCFPSPPGSLVNLSSSDTTASPLPAPTPASVLAYLTTLKTLASTPPLPAPSALLLYRHADVHVRRLLLHTPAAMEVLAVTRDGDLCSIDGFDKELGEYELERESDGSALSLPASSILLFAASPSTPEPLLSLLDLHARCLLNACRLLQKLAASPPSPDPLPGPDGPLYFALDVAQPLLKLCLLATAAVTSHYNKSPANSQDVHLWLTAHYLKARTHYLLRRFPQCLSSIAAGLALGEERGSPSNLIPALADLREKAEAGRERERKRDKRTAKAIGKHVMAVMEKSKTPLPELEG